MLFPFKNITIQAKLIILIISLLMLNSVLVGCSIGSSKSDVQQIELPPREETIESYLKGLISWPISGDEVITTFEVLGQDQDMIYLWAVQWEHYKRSFLETGKGWSNPMILTVKPSKDGELSIISHEVPREGKYYKEDIKKMFPERLHKKIFTYDSTPITTLLVDLEYEFTVKSVPPQKLLPNMLLHQLQQQFGEQASDLRLFDQTIENSRTISRFIGESGTFSIDDEGNLTGFINHRARFDSKNTLSMNEGRRAAERTVKSMKPTIKFENFQLVSSEIINNVPEVDDDQKYYSFTWEIRNKNNVTVEALYIMTNLSGGIESWKHIQNNPIVAASEIKISEDHAKDILMKRLSESGVDSPKVRIEESRKVVIMDKLVWQILYSHSYPRSTEGIEPIVSAHGIHIDAITGEIIEPR